MTVEFNSSCLQFRKKTTFNFNDKIFVKKITIVEKKNKLNISCNNSNTTNVSLLH